MPKLRIASLFLATLGSFVLTLSSASAAPVSGQSEWSTWNCTGNACPWGSQLSGQALVWPEGAVANRLGYTVDRSVYLPAAKANGMTISLEWGNVGLYAGLPDAPSHREVATLNSGGTYLVEGLAAGEVLSVQSGGQFAYVVVPVVTPPVTSPATPPGSREVTWTCTGTPCPWGSPLSGHAIVWPTSAGPTQQRLGYTSSEGVYLPATVANGMVLELSSGSASLYAGAPGADSHRLVGNVSSGSGEFQVSGIGAGEVLSVQSGTAFNFTMRRADPAAPGDPSDPVDPRQPENSPLVVWSCTGSPCPWGSPLSGHALAWPSELAPLSSRLGYSTSASIYLPAANASSVSVSVLSGTASIYAVQVDNTSYRILGTLGAGRSLALAGLVTSGELISVQGSDQFTYQISIGGSSSQPPTDTVRSIPAFWRCNAPDCSGSDWTGQVINWPASSAYESNARAGSQSRTVYSSAGEVLYPYMGAWAHGCEVTAVFGTVLVIEWQRGTDVWRETWLSPGQTHTINLVGPENGAMIETNYAWEPFGVRLNNCTPQVIR